MDIPYKRYKEYKLQHFFFLTPYVGREITGLYMVFKRALVDLVLISIRNTVVSRPVTGLYCFRSPSIRLEVDNSKADKLDLKDPKMVYKITATPISCLIMKPRVIIKFLRSQASFGLPSKHFTNEFDKKPFILPLEDRH